MADWRDNFREGSFRGVAFKTDSHTLEGGRRKQDREFARRDLGNSEDLGKKLRKFTLELLVIGDDYFEQRDALIKALETDGSGELVHPYLGTMQVQPGAYTLTESVNEMRLARFSVEFSDKGQIKFPDQVEDAFTAAINAATSLKDGAEGFFAAVFSVADAPAFVVESAVSVLEGSLDFCENVVAKVTAPITNFTFAVRDFKAALGDLVRAPDELAARIRATLDLLLEELEEDPETLESIFQGVNGIGDDPAFDPPPTTETPSRQKQIANSGAIEAAFKNVALANQAQSAVQIDFPSVQRALESRNSIVEGLDAQLETADDDDLFQAMKDVQSFLTKAVPAVGTSELISYTPPITLPALVIAYDLFEDLNKEQEIVDENSVEHPGFVPGGVPIQVSASV